MPRRPAPARPLLTALAALCLALPANAQGITPDALWQKWQEGGTDRQVTVKARSRTDAEMRLDGVTVTQTVEDGTLTATLDHMVLRPAADGSVAITIAPDQKLRLSAIDDHGTVTGRFALTGAGVTIAVTGDIAAPDYAFASEDFALALEDLISDGTAIPAEATLAITSMRGTVEGSGTPGDAPLTVTFSGDQATTEVSYEDAATGTSVHSGSAQQDFDSSISFDAAPNGTETGQGWTITGTATGGAGETRSLQTSPQTGSMETRTQVGSSDIAFGFGPERADYDVQVTGVEIALSSDQFPIPPVTFRLPRAKAAVSIPIAVSDAPQTARLGMMLKDLQIDEQIWALADPARSLPRTPAQLSLDLESDLLLQDPPVLPGPEDAAPVPGILPQSLRIRDLSLALADATLDAVGGFDFPTPEGARVPDLNAPVGRLDLEGTGIMTLLQRLAAAGILDAQQAMGAQMMLGMFATAGDGDQLTSRIVAEPGGGLVVNGNRMR